MSIAFSSSKNIDTSLEEGKLTGETINRIKALVDAPANHKTPEFLGNWAKESSKSFHKFFPFSTDNLSKIFKNFNLVSAPLSDK